MIGEHFGRWTVLREHLVSERYGLYYWCRCECGTERKVVADALKRGKSKSCGCLQRESIVKTFKKHGVGRNPLYHIWHNMMQRCYNAAHKSYNRYGGAGVVVCERWHKVENFVADMSPRPDGTSLDRIDNAGIYSPENCRWATAKQQQCNKSDNRIIEIDGVKQCLAEWCDQAGMNYYTVHARIKAGWEAKRALTQPIKKGAKAPLSHAARSLL